jgi:putative protease
MKDQCALPILDKLIDAGIDSFKIEGRMKKSEYAAFVTAMYRKYIDRYFDDPGNYRVDGDDLEKLMKVYLRSETSTGYYETGAVGDMISLDSPSYSGSDEELLAKIREKYIENSVKCGVSGYFYARAGEEIKFTLSTDERSVCVTGAVAEAARSTATTPSQIEKQLRRINDTPFEYNELQIDAGDDVFIPVSVLNTLRREAVEKLIDEFTAGEK